MVRVSDYQTGVRLDGPVATEVSLASLEAGDEGVVKAKFIDGAWRLSSDSDAVSVFLDGDAVAAFLDYLMPLAKRSGDERFIGSIMRAQAWDGDRVGLARVAMHCRRVFRK